MIYLNGQENYEIKIPIKIADLVNNLGLQKRTIAIAHNGEIIQKKNWDFVTINEKDTIEIVRAVGGG